MSRAGALVLGVLWLALLVVVDLAILLDPRHLRVQLDRALAETFVVPPTYSSIDGGWPGDLSIRDIIVPRPELPGEVLAKIAEIRIEVDWSALLAGRSPIDLVTVRDPMLQLVFDRTGALDLPSPLKTTGTTSSMSGLPKLRVEGLRLHLVNSPYLARREVDVPFDELVVDLVPGGGKAWRYDFRARIKDRALGQLDAWGHFGEQDFGLEVDRAGFQLTEGLERYLQPSVTEVLSRGRVSGGLRVRGTLERDAETGTASFVARADFEDVELSIGEWPQTLNGLHGVVRYKRGRIVTDGPLTGRFEGAALTLEGGVDFTVDPPRLDVRGALRGLDLSDAFVSRIAVLPDPGPEVCEQLRQWELRGLCDVDFRLGPNPDLDPASFSVRPDLEVRVLGCTLLYQGALDPKTGVRSGFHYPMQDVYGTVLLNDTGLRFTGLRAAAGTMSLTADATVDYRKAGDETFNARVAATSVPIDERLLAALDEETRHAVSSLRPSGQVDIHVFVERKSGGPTAVEPEVRVDLQGVRFAPDAFPWTLDDVRGGIAAKDRVIEVDGITARHDDARLTLSGRVGLDPKATFVDLDVSGRDIVLDDGIVHAVRKVAPEFAQELAALHATGKVHADLRIGTSPGQTVPRLRGDVVLERVALRPESPAIPVDALDGTILVRVSPHLSEISLAEGATAEIAGERLRVSGALFPGKGYKLGVEASGITVDTALLDALGGVVPRLAPGPERPEIDGIVDAKVAVVDDGHGPEVTARVDGRGLAVRPPGWTTARLENLFGTLHAEKGRVRLERVVAVIPRPKELPPLPPPLESGTEAPFGTGGHIEVSVHSCTFMEKGGATGIALGDLHLSDIPLEPWVLDLVSLDAVERERFRVQNLSGTMTVGLRSATLRPGSVMLNGGTVELRTIHLGPGRLFLERGTIDDFDLVLSPGGDLKFDGEFRGRNFRLLGVPVPRFEGRISGDENGLGIEQIGGVLFGFEQDRFDVVTATRRRLEQRAMDRGHVQKDELPSLSDEALRALVATREAIDLDRASREDLIRFAVEYGVLSRRVAARTDSDTLRGLLSEARLAEPLGILAGEDTRFSISFVTGLFDLVTQVDAVRIGPVVRVLGGDPGDVRGRLRARLELGGRLEDAATWIGSGYVKANAYNLIQLPVFLNVLKALTIVSMFTPSSSTSVDIGFDVSQRCVHLQKADLRGANLELELSGPGIITFGGLIDARFDAHHGSAFSIPIVSDLLGVLPSLVFNGLEIRGPLEDPTVTPRSLGSGSTPSEVAPGTRKPVLKDPKK